MSRGYSDPNSFSGGRIASRQVKRGSAFRVFGLLSVFVLVVAWALSMMLAWFTQAPENRAQVSPSLQGEPVTPHLSFAGFNPGNIISDADLHNAGSMTEDEIRQFIIEWNAGCQPGADGTPCLSDWEGEAPHFPEDQYCWELTGGYVDAAQLIHKVSQACEINPQVIVVILQKEQGLITASGKNLHPFRYRSAMGYACPDHGDCDPEYAGLPRQVYYAARQFQKYRITPEKYDYQANQGAQIPYSPDVACGSGEVFIENQATASLYNYTPHQPNVAALAGKESECSSWGNIHFYAYWHAWFGGHAARGGV